MAFEGLAENYSARIRGMIPTGYFGRPEHPPCKTAISAPDARVSTASRQGFAIRLKFIRRPQREAKGFLVPTICHPSPRRVA